MQEKIKAGLSVIIPNYNHAKLLPQALEAILAQSWQPIEIIVIDDASTDESCEIVHKYPTVTLKRLEKNSGPAIAMNVGISLAKGEYIALCASDDIVQPGFFEECMRFSTLHPEIGICFGDFYTFQDQRATEFEKQVLLPIAGPQVFSPNEFVKTCAHSQFYIPSQTSIYKKEYVLENGCYRSELKSLCDFYLNCQIALRHPVGYIPRAFGAYRIADNSYARSVRFHLRKRNSICTSLMHRINHEDEEFKERLRKSGILAQAGIYMIAFLGLRIRYWPYFLPAFKKRFFHSK